MNQPLVSRPKGARPFMDLTLEQARAARPANFVVKNDSTLSAVDAADGVIEILDTIGGWGVYASEVIPVLRAMDGADKTLVIRINSYGGDVFEGLAIANTIADLQARTVVEIIGVAASIASVIAVAADEVRIRKSAQMMIHRPWALTWGEAGELRAVADHLDKIEGQLVDTYADRSAGKKDQAALAAAVAAETWLTGAEAVEWGLADAVLEKAKVSTKVDNAALEAAGIKNAPADLLVEAEAPAEAVKAAAAEAVAEAAPTAEEVIPADDEKNVEANANAPTTAANNASYDDHQVAAIRAAFARTKKPGVADEVMAAGLSVEQAKAQAFDMLAEEDAASPIATAIVGTEGSAPPQGKTPEQLNAEIRARQLAEFQPKNR